MFQGLNRRTELINKSTLANLRLEALIEFILDLASEREPGRLIEQLCESARQLTSAHYALAGMVPQGGHAPERLIAAGLDWTRYSSSETTAQTHAAVAALIKDYRAVRVPNPKEPSRTYGWLCLFRRLGGLEFTQLARRTSRR